MNGLQKITLAVVVATAAMAGFLIGRHYPLELPFSPLESKVDTLVIFDTIVQNTPISATKRVVEYVPVPVVDTMRVHDTLVMYLEREQLVWRDSLSEVYASGINPQVDSVRHFVQKEIITREIPVPVTKRTRWGVGVQAGYGIGKGGLSPYVGVGISYNLLSW